MADIAFIDDLKQIKSLWLNVFAGDDDKTVEFFYKNCLHKNASAHSAMISRFPCFFLLIAAIAEKKGAYVYAVCTPPNSEVGAFREA